MGSGALLSLSAKGYIQTVLSLCCVCSFQVHGSKILGVGFIGTSLQGQHLRLRSTLRTT